MQKRINAHHLHPDHQKILRFVENTKEPPTRLELGRRFSGSSIEMLVATGHLADAIVRGHDCMMVTALTEKELANLAPWRKREDDHLRTNWAVGSPIKTIAEGLGRSGGEVVSRAWKLNLVRQSRWGSAYVEARNFRRLRCRLIDAERRALRSDDNGEDLIHRAERRRYQFVRKLLKSQNWEKSAFTRSEFSLFLKLQKRDLSVSMIAVMLCRDAREIAHKQSAFARRLAPNLNNEEKNQIVLGFKSGLNLNAVSALLPGRHKRTISIWAKRLCPESFCTAKQWSPHEDRKLLEAFLKGYRPKRLAEMFPTRSRRAVQAHINDLVHARKKKPLSMDEMRILVAALKRGETIEDMANWLARDVHIIAEAVRRPRVDLSAGSRLLSRDQISAIKEKRTLEGLTHASLGRLFSVSETTISRCLNGAYDRSN